nr:uncharacterized protein LOC123763640 [Procambarus clarkii]
MQGAGVQSMGLQGAGVQGTGVVQQQHQHGTTLAPAVTSPQITSQVVMEPMTGVATPPEVTSPSETTPSTPPPPTTTTQPPTPSQHLTFGELFRQVSVAPLALVCTWVIDVRQECSEARRNISWGPLPLSHPERSC